MEVKSSGVAILRDLCVKGKSSHSAKMDEVFPLHSSPHPGYPHLHTSLLPRRRWHPEGSPQQPRLAPGLSRRPIGFLPGLRVFLPSLDSLPRTSLSRFLQCSMDVRVLDGAVFRAVMMEEGEGRDAHDAEILRK